MTKQDLRKTRITNYKKIYKGNNQHYGNDESDTDLKNIHCMLETMVWQTNKSKQFCILPHFEQFKITAYTIHIVAKSEGKPTL